VDDAGSVAKMKSEKRKGPVLISISALRKKKLRGKEKREVETVKKGMEGITAIFEAAWHWSNFFREGQWGGKKK